MISRLDPQSSTVLSDDGTTIGYHSLGDGPGLIVIGGALCSGLDYRDLAVALAGSYTVHLVDRRGRGLSGSQSDDYGLDDEHNDLAAVAAATNSRLLFGHSFGGLIALEAARSLSMFEHIVVYEPGVPISGGLQLGWLDSYEQMLCADDGRGAFACMVKGAGYAPAALTRMPDWYVRAVLRLVVRRRRWQTIEPHLRTNLAEHRILSAITTPTADRFKGIPTPTVLLGGERSPGFAHHLLDELHAAIATSTVELLAGLGHDAPQHRPEAVGGAILRHLTSSA